MLMISKTHHFLEAQEGFVNIAKQQVGLQVQVVQLVVHLLAQIALSVVQRWCVGQASMDPSLGVLDIRIAKEPDKATSGLLGDSCY